MTGPSSVTGLASLRAGARLLQQLDTMNAALEDTSGPAGPAARAGRAAAYAHAEHDPSVWQRRAHLSPAMGDERSRDYVPGVPGGSRTPRRHPRMVRGDEQPASPSRGLTGWPLAVRTGVRALVLVLIASWPALAVLAGGYLAEALS